MERRARILITVGLTATTAGLAISGTVNPTAGGVISVVGWLALSLGLHQFGRASTAAVETPPPSELTS